jgi:glutamine amidotransferase
MSKPGLAIIDGGGANIASLKFALARLGRGDALLTADPAVIRAADRVILPGVGAARDAMDRLKAAGLVETIAELTQPLLGICLGMQLLFESSAEDDTDCLGMLPGRAERFVPGPDHTVPHMGWNRVVQTRSSSLFDGIADGAQFYFVHSYALPVSDDTIGSCDYGGSFTAVVQRGNVMGTQFHPERSGSNGARLLENFLRIRS